MAALKKRAKAKALPAPAVKTEAETRVKLVRDSFTMPSEDYALIALLKSRAIDFKRPAKKSELLRAGLQVLMQLPDGSLQAALNALRTLPTGRPKKKR